MKNNEHLALFVLGIGTLCITFLLLFAMNNHDVTSHAVVDQQSSGSVAQADVIPQSQTPERPSMDALDQQIEDTFAKTAAYLGQGKYDEKEHIALLERLEFYSGMSSIKPEYRKTAQDYVKDMGRLLTLKESVARRVQVAGQINAVETDVQMFLAKGVKDKVAARKLMDRIDALYSLQGLSDSQNQQLRTSLAALKNAYKPTATASAAPTVHRQAVAPKAHRPAAPVVVAKAAPKPKAAPAPKPVPAAPVATATPQPAPKATQKTASAAPPPQKTISPQDKKTIDKYYRVMTLISSYFVKRKYNHDYHTQLTADLLDIAKNKKALSAGQQDRLEKTIDKMNHIEEHYGPKAAAR